MPVETFKVNWLPEADQLLGKRDHYTREAIQSEFKKDPEKGAIQLDLKKHWHVTPVANKRFIVVWQMEGEQGGERVANVRAVVPAQLLNGDTEQIKSQVAKVVAMESKGTITLY